MKDTSDIKGIHIRSFNYLTIIIALILYVILLYETVNISRKYQDLLDTTQDYIASEKDAAQLGDGSDYLTEQIRLFVIDMDPSYMEAYFTEADVTKRRDNALTDLQQYHSNDEIYQALERALNRSNELMETEIYAMRLISTANGYAEETLPTRVRETVLTSSDQNLSKEEMISKAQHMVFDSSYQKAKEDIFQSLSDSIEPILQETKQKHIDSADNLQATITHDQMVLNVLLLVNIISFFSIVVLIIRPLRSYNKSIDNNRPLDVSGAYEFRYLARTYNDVYSKNAANEADLRKKAEVDALTGILNRGAFDQFTALLENVPKNIALLLIDADDFKAINDNYGHDIGDQILKKIADTLTLVFRSSDHIARIGGDEFAVIMSDVQADHRSVIQSKIDAMNQELTHPLDGLPPISLSIGIAFSANGYNKDLFHHADHALYQAKDAGRCGCAFYEAEK
jgi:diguanylate cyclase (GGDEF)-like protein